MQIKREYVYSKAIRKQIIRESNVIIILQVIF